MQKRVALRTRKNTERIRDKGAEKHCGYLGKTNRKI
jgi:hypothetical protein